jgi:hypothetical protein
MTREISFLDELNRDKHRAGGDELNRDKSETNQISLLSNRPPNYERPTGGSGRGSE